MIRSSPVTIKKIKMLRKSTSNTLDDATSLRNRVAQANRQIYDSAGVQRYVEGAPHIKHASLRQLYADTLVEVFQRAQLNSPMPRVLDLGAGDGSVTLPLLELGAHVTAVDISPDQVSALEKRCSQYADRLMVRCEDISLFLASRPGAFDIVVMNFFLHHIPDYIAMLRYVIPVMSKNGQFFSFQDPLLYSSQSPIERFYDKAAYGAWRLARGDVWGGLKRWIRRARGVYLADSPHDNSEYHVLRDGVDHQAISGLFESNGYTCRIIRYFSTQSRVFQTLGAMAKMKNTFAIVAFR
jgi:2-polyprenyl-3-methyl-5-hydroxy-6-metoxy-1,4-benzoquinol methylase